MKKYRIAVYYEGKSRVGRNDGPPLYWWNALRSFKNIEVHHLIPDPNLPQDFGTFDLNLWVDWGEDALNLPYKPIPMKSPSAYVTSDTHLGYEYRMNKAKEFDRVYCNQQRAVDEFGRDGVKAVFLPHAVDTQAYYPHEIIKKYDVVFIGHINGQKRIDFLDRIFREFPNFYYGQALFEDAARKFCEGKIVLNTAAVDDINMRVFEALATNSLLLTEQLPYQGQLFKDKEHLIYYSNLDEAVRRIKYYLEHDSEREAIAASGYKEVKNSHTYKHRAKKVLEDFGIEYEE